MTDWTPVDADTAERYRRRGWWTGARFGSFLSELAQVHADRVAVVAGDDRWTYGELDQRATGAAVGFAELGVAAGDRVVLQLGNEAAFLEVLFGLWRLGAVPVFALPAHRETDLGQLLQQSGAAALVTSDQRLARLLAEAVPRVVTDLASVRSGATELTAACRQAAPHELGMLQLSGGTTGTPKLIPRTPDDYLYSVRASAGICRLGPDDRYLAALPVGHNYPLSSPGVLGALSAGAQVVLSPAPQPDVALALLACSRATVVGLVPPLAAVWAQAARRHDVSSLRLLQVGGARCTRELALRLREAFPGAVLQQVFGMAEGLVNYTRLDDPAERVDDCQGRPISPDDEVRIVSASGDDVPEGEVGSLLTRGPYTIRSYYRTDSASFTPDGFYATGDLVRRTPTGDLVVEGRTKDQVNRGGEKVACEEVEDHLLAHPAVLEAAVVGVPDRFLGERTHAWVLLREGAVATPAQIRQFMGTRGLAAYKVPDRVEIAAALPGTAVGKTSKVALRAYVRAAHSPPAPPSSPAPSALPAPSSSPVPSGRTS